MDTTWLRAINFSQQVFPFPGQLFYQNESNYLLEEQLTLENIQLALEDVVERHRKDALLIIAVLRMTFMAKKEDRRRDGNGQL